MKKVLLVLAMAGVLVACGNKKKEDKPTPGDDTAAKTTNNPPANNGDANAATATSGVPTFSDPEVQKYANDITEILNSYKAAVAGKEMTKIPELSAKWTDWSSRAMSVSQKLTNNPEEAEKWGNYWKKISEEWTAAMQSMIPVSK